MQLKYLTLLFVLGQLFGAEEIQKTLPDGVFTRQKDQFIEFVYPDQMDLTAQIKNIEQWKPKFGLIKLQDQWAPEDWAKASFDLKSFIVSIKAVSPDTSIGLDGKQSLIETLLQFDLAPYIDGYLFEDIPWIPDEDETGKGWYRANSNPDRVLTDLADAGSVGAYCVLLDGMDADPALIQLLDAINHTGAGTMDQQPSILNIQEGAYQLFFDPGNSVYYLAFHSSEGGRTLFFNLKPDLDIKVIYPETNDLKVSLYGERVEVVTRPGYFLVSMKMKKPDFQVETIKVQSKASIDPYELVVKNQVFKKQQAGEWSTLEANQELNYRYQAPSGATVDVTYQDALLWKQGQPIEHVRQKMFINGVAWPYDDLPELPLIQPEKVQSEPLVINLDKSYTYTYAGEDTVRGRKMWKVKFKPQGEGNFYSGTVWIDQETGAHFKIRAIQGGLEPPVVGNEITVFYDWVKDQGRSYWLQVREEALQVLNVVGVRIPLQISSVRSNFKLDPPEFEKDKAEFYQSDAIMLRDTEKGLRYLKNSGGQRIVSEDVFSKQKFVVGGVLYDPGMKTPVPLAGFNYVNLDFLKRGLQANFFIAGAINDIIVSDNDLLGKGWDLTGELFASALYLSDSVYRLGNEIKEEQVDRLTESFNMTLGIPMGPFFKMEANVASRYIDFKKGSDMAEDFVLPSSHFENQASLRLFFNRGRLNTSLQHSWIKRSQWDAWGLPDNPEPLFDSYRRIELDSSYSFKLKNFQSIQLSGRFLKGWDLDRFSRFGFGFFENHVAGFGASGIEASQAVRLRIGYERGVKELFQAGLRLDAARAWQDDLLGVPTTPDGSPVDLMGLGAHLNMIGPWKTIIRLEVGYGLKADLANEAGDFTGQILFLKLF